MSEPRDELRRVLDDWRSGRRESREVRDWADAKEAEGWKDDAVVRDIVSHLAIADINLTTPDEIPLFLRMLELPDAEAREVHERYGAAQDMAAVRERWKEDPFYGPFCR